jgi:hypothetical protein
LRRPIRRTAQFTPFLTKLRPSRAPFSISGNRAMNCASGAASPARGRPPSRRAAGLRTRRSSPARPRARGPCPAPPGRASFSRAPIPLQCLRRGRRFRLPCSSSSRERCARAGQVSAPGMARGTSRASSMAL